MKYTDVIKYIWCDSTVFQMELGTGYHQSISQSNIESEVIRQLKI